MLKCGLLMVHPPASKWLKSCRWIFFFGPVRRDIITQSRKQVDALRDFLSQNILHRRDGALECVLPDGVRNPKIVW